MRIQEAMGMGVPAGTAAAIAGSCAVQAVSGSSATDATLITAANVVITSSSSNQGVILPADAQIGDTFRIGNATGNTIKVYPPASGQLNGETATTGFKSISTLKGATFTRVTPVHWICTVE